MPFTQYARRSESRSSIDNEVPQYLAGLRKESASRIAPAAGAGGLDVYADEVRQEHAGGKIFRAGYGAVGSEIWPLDITSERMLRVYDSDGQYSDTAIQRAGDGLIFRAGYGPPGAETWMLDITKNGTMIRNLIDGGGGMVHDVRAYGPWVGANIVGGVWTGPDNGATLQAAIDAAKAGGAGTSQAVYIPKGVFLVGPQDCTNIPSGIVIRGDGPFNTRLMPSVACNGWPLFDCCGSGGMHFLGLGISDTAQPSTPTAGIVIANSSTSGATSNIHVLEDVWISGSWSRACLYVAAGASSRVSRSIFTNHNGLPGIPAVWFTGTNAGAISSHFTTLSTVGGVTEWSFFGCEIHDVGRLSGASPGYAAIIDTASMINFHGGNIGGNGPAIVNMLGSCLNISFFGVQMYAQDPSGVAAVAALKQSGGSTSGLVVVGCRTDASGQVLEIGPSLFVQSFLYGGNSVFGGAPRLVGPTSGSITLVSPQILDGRGLQIALGGAGSIIQRGIINNASVVSGTYNAMLLGPTAPALPAAATDPATTMALANSIRSALIACGITT